MGKILRLRSTFSRPADATAYAAGDEISSNATAGSVVRATFDLTGFARATILAAALDITPASGNFVVVAADLELQIYKTADVPAAVGDNVTHPIGAATQCKALGTYRYDDGAWLNQLGGVVAGTSGFQDTMASKTLPLATPGLQAAHVPGNFIDFTGSALSTSGRQLTAVLRALAAWTPLGVVNAIGITLDIEAV